MRIAGKRIQEEICKLLASQMVLDGLTLSKQNAARIAFGARGHILRNKPPTIIGLIPVEGLQHAAETVMRLREGRLQDDGLLQSSYGSIRLAHGPQEPTEIEVALSTIGIAIKARLVGIEGLVVVAERVKVEARFI
jgi:hypothetical protein